MKNIHINLVGGQVLPNIIPTLSDRDCDEVILFFGDDKEKKSSGIRLEKIYNKHKRKIVHQISSKDSVDYQHLIEKAG